MVHCKNESIELYPEFEGVEKCLQALKKMERRQVQTLIN